jgi:hypothetical protein
MSFGVIVNLTARTVEGSYCDQHPLGNFLEAVWTLAEELKMLPPVRFAANQPSMNGIRETKCRPAQRMFRYTKA